MALPSSSINLLWSQVWSWCFESNYRQIISKLTPTLTFLQIFNILWQKKIGCFMTLSLFEILHQNWSRTVLRTAIAQLDLSWGSFIPQWVICISPSQRSLIRDKMWPSATVLLVHLHGLVYYQLNILWQKKWMLHELVTIWNSWTKSITSWY
jgi:hypothetical protein